MASLDGSVPGTDVTVVDWRVGPTAKPRKNPPPPQPRPLHSSRSATNALTHGLSLDPSLSLTRTQLTTNASTATLPHSLHKRSVNFSKVYLRADRLTSDSNHSVIARRLMIEEATKVVSVLTNK